MQVIKLLFLLLLVGVPAFAEEMSDLNPTEELLIDVANATNATKQGFCANMTAIFNSTNATNATGITAFLDDSNSTAEAETKDSPAPANIEQNTSAEITKQPDSSEKAEMPQSTPSPSGVRTVPLSYLTSMRALIEARKLEVALAKEDKKLRELYAPDPALTTALLKKPAQKKKCRSELPKIVSIQGVDGRLSATLSSSAGVETVTEGSNAGPGRIVSITPSKVLVRVGGKNVALKFKE